MYTNTNPPSLEFSSQSFASKCVEEKNIKKINHFRELIKIWKKKKLFRMIRMSLSSFVLNFFCFNRWKKKFNRLLFEFGKTRRRIKVRHFYRFASCNIREFFYKNTKYVYLRLTWTWHLNVFNFSTESSTSSLVNHCLQAYILTLEAANISLKSENYRVKVFNSFYVANKENFKMKSRKKEVTEEQK